MRYDQKIVDYWNLLVLQHLIKIKLKCINFGAKLKYGRRSRFGIFLWTRQFTIT